MSKEQESVTIVCLVFLHVDAQFMSIVYHGDDIHVC
jgi:hypothetical protein